MPGEKPEQQRPAAEGRSTAVGPIVGSDESELRQQLHELQRENERLRATLAGVEYKPPGMRRIRWPRLISRAFESRAGISEVVDSFAEHLADEFEVQRVVIFRWDDKTERLVAAAQGGHADSAPMTLRSGQGIAGCSFDTGRAINVKDASADVRTYKPFNRMLGVAPEAVLCVPLANRFDDVRGVIQLINPHGRAYFSISEQRDVEGIASTLVLLIENAELLMREIQRNFDLNETREELETRVRELDELYELGRGLFEARNASQMYRLVARTALRVAPSDACVVSIIRDAVPESYVFMAATDGLEPTTGARAHSAPRVAARGENYQRAISGCSPQRFRKDAVDESWLGEAVRTDVDSHLIVPLHAEDHCIGAIELVNRRRNSMQTGGYSNADVRLLSVIAGQATGVINVELERVAEERSERIAAIGSMVSGIFHDLKTPLTIASGYVQLMERSEDETTRAQFGGAVQKQFDHIQQMIREVISYARGEHEVFDRNVHVSLFARELQEWLSHDFSGFDIAVDVRCSFDGGARFDEGKLKRILFNLSRNARDAMRDGGSYNVEISRDGDMLAFRCRDTGGGIPEHLQPRLFEAFVSEGKRHKSGLGLAIVRRLIDEMGGRVTFDSELGVGTEFVVRIPWHPLVSEDDS